MRRHVFAAPEGLEGLGGRCIQGFSGTDRETVGIARNRIDPLALRGADADHRLLDAVLVHLGDGPGDLVLVRVGDGDVLEHVLDGHLEHFLALRVHQVRLDEFVHLLVVRGDGNAEHQVDDADILEHGHGEITFRYYALAGASSE